MIKAVVPNLIVSEVLDEDNYEDWSEEIEAYLKAQDLWDVVEDDEQPPKKEEKEWKKKNAAALHAIKISCGTNIRGQIRGIREANKVWSFLSGFFDDRQSDMNDLIFSDALEEHSDVENVDNEHKEVYKHLDDAFSKSDLCAALSLCKNDPLLLTKTLPDHRLVLNELIKLGGRDHQEKVVEILCLEQDNESLKTLSGVGLSNGTPLEVAVCVGAIEIARRLVGMNPELLFYNDSLGYIPLAVAIGSHMKEMANTLYSLTPEHLRTQENNSERTATVIIKCFEEDNLDIALKLLNSLPKEFILTNKDINGKSPLCAAARAAHLFRGTYHHRFLAKYICKVLGPRLPVCSMNFEISGMELLIFLGNAIRDSTNHRQNYSGDVRELLRHEVSRNSERTKIDIVSKAFFEAIKHENFNFILMLINSIKNILYLKDDESRNMYMLAIAHRHTKLFSLFFWDEGVELSHLWRDKWRNNLLHMVGASTRPIACDRISKPVLQMKRELTWFKEVEKLVPDLLRKSRNRDGKTPLELFNESHKDLMMEAGKWMKESASSWAIVGPLIITIMFAAAFQVPGESLQDKGYPVFLEEWLFKVYMVLVAMSLFSATISVLKFLEILSANYEEEDFLASLRTYNVITGTLFLSLATMLIAFCMGLFLTLHGELAIFLPIATISTFLVGYIICTKLPQMAKSLNFFTFEEVRIPFIKWRTSIFDRNIGHEVELIFRMLNPRPPPK